MLYMPSQPVRSVPSQSFGKLQNSFNNVNSHRAQGSITFPALQSFFALTLSINMSTYKQNNSSSSSSNPLNQLSHSYSRRSSSYQAHYSPLVSPTSSPPTGPSLSTASHLSERHDFSPFDENPFVAQSTPTPNPSLPSDQV